MLVPSAVLFGTFLGLFVAESKVSISFRRFSGRNWNFRFVSSFLNRFDVPSVNFFNFYLDCLNELLFSKMVDTSFEIFGGFKVCAAVYSFQAEFMFMMFKDLC